MSERSGSAAAKPGEGRTDAQRARRSNTAADLTRLAVPSGAGKARPPAQRKSPWDRTSGERRMTTAGGLQTQPM
eukprot:3467936-Heterocapsa_arctica.AAC.2